MKNTTKIDYNQIRSLREIVKKHFGSMPDPIQFCFFLLLKRGLEDEVGLELFVEANVDNLLEACLWELYTTLPPRARDTAREISMPNSPPIGDDYYNPIGIDQLKELGWLTLDKEFHCYMPAILKEYAYKQFERWGSPPYVRRG